MHELCGWRSAALKAARAQIEEMQAEHGTSADIALLWYTAMDDWASLPGREPVTWRPQCSVLAAIYGEYSQARLVAFDGPAYSAWLGKRRDTEAQRAAWAAELA